MPSLAATAHAKVNLTLRVLGRRDDGFHELASLVAFARIGDLVELTPGIPPSLAVEGPFAAALAGDSARNLVLRAAEAVALARPAWRTGAIRLVKQIPVAAGLGGGSADAAAMLTLCARANGEAAVPPDLVALAPGLGTDVPVCLLSRAALIWGAGEQVRVAPPLPACYAVLVNPGAALATVRVYEAHAAAPVAADSTTEPAMPAAFPDVLALARHVREAGNDLQPVAMSLVPAVGDAMAALAAQDGCLAAQMSGSGATCFGLFADSSNAATAARAIAAAHPGWWVEATELR